MAPHPHGKRSACLPVDPGKPGQERSRPDEPVEIGRIDQVDLADRQDQDRIAEIAQGARSALEPVWSSFCLKHNVNEIHFGSPAPGVFPLE
jgi:hypothetical protein